MGVCTWSHIIMSAIIRAQTDRQTPGWEAPPHAPRESLRRGRQPLWHVLFLIHAPSSLPSGG